MAVQSHPSQVSIPPYPDRNAINCRDDLCKLKKGMNTMTSRTCMRCSFREGLEIDWAVLCAHRLCNAGWHALGGPVANFLALQRLG